MKEKVKIVSDLGDVMFEVILPERYLVQSANRKLLKRYIVSTKKVPIGTGNAGNALEYETVYDGYQMMWSDFKSIADEDDGI